MIIILVLLFSAQDFVPEYKGSEDETSDFERRL